MLTERAIKNHVGHCYRMVARQGGLDPRVAESLEAFAVAVEDWNYVTSDQLLPLLAGQSSPARILNGLAEILNDDDDLDTVVADLRRHATALDGWQVQPPQPGHGELVMRYGQPVLDLLAVLNRDGGHRVEEVGVDQAAMDALTRFYGLLEAEGLADS